MVTQGPWLWFTLCISLVESHPGTKGFERPNEEASSAATWHYGLCLDHIGCKNLAKWTVGGRGMIGWSASIWSKGRLLKGPVLVKIKSCGESAPPLQSVKSKYLAMSLVKDKLNIKTWKLSRISSSKFLSYKLVVEQELKDLQSLIGRCLGKVLSKKNLVFSTDR